MPTGSTACGLGLRIPAVGLMDNPPLLHAWVGHGGLHGVLSRTIALRIVSILRNTAIRAAFGSTPRPKMGQTNCPPDRKRAANHRRDRHRHEPLASEYHFASRTTLRPQQQNLRWTPAQHQDSVFGQPVAAILRRCAMSVGKTSTALAAFYRHLPAPHRKSQSHHRHCAQARAVRLPRAVGTAPLSQTRCRRLPSTPSHPGTQGRCATAPNCSVYSSSIALPVKCRECVCPHLAVMRISYELSRCCDFTSATSDRSQYRRTRFPSAASRWRSDRIRVTSADAASGPERCVRAIVFFAVSS